MTNTKRRDMPTVIPIIILLLFVSLSLCSSDRKDVEEFVTVPIIVLSECLVYIKSAVYNEKINSFLHI